MTAIAALAAGMSLGAPLARAAEVGTYFQGYSPGTLMEAKSQAGLNRATLAFGITRGSCVLDPYLTNRLADARSFVGAGGQLTISMGGADGTYAEIACSDDQLVSLLESLMQDAGTRRIDWDVEGGQLNNTDATARRNRVLSRLQAKYPDFYTSFTLPSWLNGLQANGMALLRSTLGAGVRIDRVNIMAMTFGVDNVRTMVSPSTMGQAVVMAMQATASQLATLYPGKSAAQVRAMMGVTPMIGTNDDGAVLTLADARTVTGYVKTNGIGYIGYWSFQRDRAQSAAGMMPVNDYSGVAQASFDFLKTFKAAEGAVPAPAPAPAPAVCGAPWVMWQNYPAGSLVTYNGAVYVAKYANPGYNPTISTYYWAPYAPAWTVGKYYAAGAIVSYQGKMFRAKYANPGYNPTISTYYWAPYSC